MKEVKRREERRSEGGTEEMEGEMDNDVLTKFSRFHATIQILCCSGIAAAVSGH